MRSRATSVGAVEQLTQADRKLLPRYRVPCFRMGQLNAALTVGVKGIGRLLIGCAVERCLRSRAEVAAFALVVDAKDKLARDFYQHFGFVAFASQPLSLYLSLGRSQ